MYLKRLEILGFKSFANKTVVKFSSGVTAIVGPNGCGKTNILDALRWVLGEQKISMLRGSKMEEVIFNGTRDVKPLGMSEVTLTMVNDRGVLPTEYTEIQVTRRLFRSGESEYLLNKVPCRLKDITELFLDTGVGAHSYSVIQQDMIEAVISDKAEERRFLFEEASGITKYKARKKAALRKLEATDQDLLRLNDIHSEVKTRVNSLNRQYKKAERYQMIRDEIKNWELFLSSTRLKAIELEKRELKAKTDSLSDGVVHKETEVDKFSSDLESIRTEQLNLEQEVSAVANEVFEITEQAHSLEKEISVQQEKSANAKTVIERNSNDINALKVRSDLLAEQTGDVRVELTEHKEQFEQVNRNLESASIRQSEADRALLGARASKDNENQKLIELEGKLSSGRTEEESLRAHETDLAKTLCELENQKTEVVEKVQKTKSASEELQESTQHVIDRKTKAESDQIDLSNELESKVEENETLGAELSNLAAAVEASQARKELLEDMILHYEGHESGVVAAMEERERWPGIAGTVAEKFVPVEGLEIALEAALGEMSGFMICNDRKSAEQIVSYLKNEKLGKAGILVPDSGTLNPVVKRPEIKEDHFVGWLDSFVSTDEHLRPLMQAVLSRIAVYKADSSPESILQHLPYGFKAVSTEGLIYSKNIIVGGSSDSLPLFRRKEKVEDEVRNLSEFQTKIESTQDEKNRVVARIASIRAESSNLAGNIESLHEEIIACQKRIDGFSYELKGFQTDIERLDREHRQHREKIDGIRNRQYTLELDSGQLATEKQDLVATITESGSRLEDYETNSVKATEDVSGLQVRMVEVKSRIEQADSKIVHQEELQQEISNTVNSKETEINQAESDIGTSKETVSTREITLKEIFETRARVNERQTVLKTRHAEINEQVTGIEKQIKALRSERENLSQELHQLDIRINTIESEIGSIVERIHEEYELDIHTVEPEKPSDELDPDQARTFLQEKKEQLKNFGAVNLLALEEYKEAFEREKFLNEHLTDLVKAKTDLESTIHKINQTARDLFSEAFAQVQKNFSELFVELFSGGEAELKLSDPSDPLESGIDIIARPRGKKLISITMMSGGERALTAIALLFSLYLVKPSPYCILDEIDAPLDDANCHRFLKMIHKFSRNTQFIAITHNKITMEAAHNLYGVTMDQPGISKLVGVRFSDADPRNEESIIDLESDQDETDESITTNEESVEIENDIALPEAVAERMSSNVTAPSEEDDPVNK